jgi:transposase-like protein
MTKPVDPNDHSILQAYPAPPEPLQKQIESMEVQPATESSNGDNSGTETTTTTTVARPPRITRRSYPNEFRIQVIEYARNHTSSEAAKHYGIHSSMVTRWIKTADEIYSAARNSKRIGHSGRPVTFLELEEQLAQHIRTTFACGVNMTAENLREQMMLLVRQTGNEGKWRNFKCSYGWMRGFMRRHNFINGAPKSRRTRANIFYPMGALTPAESVSMATDSGQQTPSTALEIEVPTNFSATETLNS